MTKLHIFNPEHDISLAHNDKYFTAPGIARRLRSDCGFIPSLWAEDGDYVLVDDAARAKTELTRLGLEKNVNFITSKDLHFVPNNVCIEPWGWDSALCFQLVRNGLKTENIPDDDCLNDIRNLSSRSFSSPLLAELRQMIDPQSTFTVGESLYIRNIDELNEAISKYSDFVLKEPWSSSGRGVRHLTGGLEVPTLNWIRNIIKRQGGIMFEPYYNKIRDFGMEFVSDASGIHYHGLSEFKAENGFYYGNMVISENQKVKLLSELLPFELIRKVREGLEAILRKYLTGRYIGPLGVDMMIVNDHEKNRIHPMVEINMRRTMGHVAIDIMKNKEIAPSVIRINSTGKGYQFVIEPLSDSDL